MLQKSIKIILVTLIVYPKTRSSESGIRLSKKSLEQWFTASVPNRHLMISTSGDEPSGTPGTDDSTWGLRKHTKLNNDGKVIFGSTVFLENLDTGEKINYKIVGRDEADLKSKLIYYQSPIGRGLIGKNKNDLVEISTPAGKKNFEIKDVKYI